MKILCVCVCAVPGPARGAVPASPAPCASARGGIGSRKRASESRMAASESVSPGAPGRPSQAPLPRRPGRRKRIGARLLHRRGAMAQRNPSRGHGRADPSRPAYPSRGLGGGVPRFHVDIEYIYIYIYIYIYKTKILGALYWWTVAMGH